MPSGPDGGAAREGQACQPHGGFKEGDAVRGTVKAVNDFGVFLDVGTGREAFLPWKQVLGGSPGAGDVLDLIVATVDDKGRLTLAAPGGKGRTVGFGGKGRGGSTTSSVGGFIYDVELGARRRRKGGKGDGQGAYTYPDGMPFSDLLPEDDVSGHITNVEKEGCWIDIGAGRDAFLRWETAPRNSVRWQVGDLVDDLKIQSVSGQEVLLRWDDEGISSLTSKEWEKLFADGPCVPKPKEEDEGPVVGENCCAILGNLRSAAATGIANGRSEEEDGAWAARKGGTGRGRADGKGPAQDGSGPGRGKANDESGGKSGGWSSPEAGRAKGRGRGGMDGAVGKGPGWDASKGAGRGAKGWGKGEGPAYEAADGYGSCAQPAEARARSAPPPTRQRLRPIEDVSIGEVVRGRVVGLSRVGALVDFGCAVEGLVPRALVTARCRKGQVIPRLNVMGVDISSGRVTLEPLEDEPND
mmetsp:Transcript_103320/g.274835  ORF Transcript_103320/g.274835 Transcript_103320/m.274835 type:complete len:469 (-) Transcript_103320:178-1584(-)